MSKYEEIKQAVAELTAAELADLRAWLDELDEQRFDAQIELDEASGKLEALAARGRENLRTGRVRDL